MGSAFGSNESPFRSTAAAMTYSLRLSPRPAIVSFTMKRNNSRRLSAPLKALLLRTVSTWVLMTVSSATGREGNDGCLCAPRMVVRTERSGCLFGEIICGVAHVPHDDNVTPRYPRVTPARRVKVADSRLEAAMEKKSRGLRT